MILAVINATYAVAKSKSENFYFFRLAFRNCISCVNNCEDHLYIYYMTICGLFLHHGNTEDRKNHEQKFILQICRLNPNGINKRSSFN